MSKKPPKRPIFHVCTTSDGNYLVRTQKSDGAPPQKIFVPWLIEGDPRFFVRNGELIKPHGIVEFALKRIEECPELPHDRAFYTECSRAEFDPSGCVQVKYFDIGKVEDQLNAAQKLLETRFADAPAGAA